MRKRKEPCSRLRRSTRIEARPVVLLRNRSRSRASRKWTTAFVQACTNTSRKNFVREQKESRRFRRHEISMCSSVGRAPACQVGGRGFKTRHMHQSRLGSSVGRALSWYERGHRFNSDLRLHASVAQLVEQLTRNEQATGSTPVRGSNALVAQLVEQPPCKRQVAGSTPGQGPQSPLTTTKKGCA